MANPESVNKVRKIATNILDYFSKNLITRGEWGNITFKEAETDLDQAKDLISYLINLPIEVLPENLISPITPHLNEVGSQINAIDQFDIKKCGGQSEHYYYSIKRSRRYLIPFYKPMGTLSCI